MIIWKPFFWPCLVRLAAGNTNTTKPELWKQPSALWKTLWLPIKEGNGLCPYKDAVGARAVSWATWQSSGREPSSLSSRSASVWPWPPAPGAGWRAATQLHPASETTETKTQRTGKQTERSGGFWAERHYNGRRLFGSHAPWFGWRCPESPQLRRFGRGFSSVMRSKKRRSMGNILRIQSCGVWTCWIYEREMITMLLMEQIMLSACWWKEETSRASWRFSW